MKSILTERKGRAKERKAGNTEGMDKVGMSEKGEGKVEKGRKRCEYR